MIRKQVYIEQAQDEILKRLAAEMGVSEAEVIRLAIEALAAAGRYGIRGVADTHAVRETAVLYRTDNTETNRARDADREALLELLADVRERARTGKRLEGGRDWTREDLYDERPKYLSR